jgi:threonine dehydrogenase-like Zn-dependent dehydrogenase
VNAIYFEPETPLPAAGDVLLEMYTKGIRVATGRVHARPAMDPILELVRKGRLRPELVTAETADWDDAAEAITDHRGKLVIGRDAG